MSKKKSENRITFEDEKIIKIEIISKGKSYECIFDASRKKEFMKYTWCLDGNKYASTRMNRRVVRMHKIVCSGKLVDHIDKNKTNNTEINLRSTTQSINTQNSTRSKTYTSKYRGVYFHKKDKVYEVNVRGKYIGRCQAEISAAYAYNEYLLQHYSKDAEFLKTMNKVDRPKDYRGPQYKLKTRQDLPKGVVYYPNRKYKYRVRINYKSYISPYKYFATKEEAIQQAAEIRKEYQEKWEKEIDSLPITRNNEGVAVIRSKKWKENLDDTSKKLQEFLVDDDLWYELMKFTWFSTGKYAHGTDEKCKGVRMHRYIMNCDELHENYNVDHRNGNGLDNRRSNLRLFHKNDPIHVHNQKKKSGCSSVFKGVSYHKESKSWASQINYNHKVYSYKKFSSQIEAARFYDEKAIELYGKEATLNFPLPDPITQNLLEEHEKQKKSILQKRQRDGENENEYESSSKRQKLEI